MGSIAIVILANCSNSELGAKLLGAVRMDSIKYIFLHIQSLGGRLDTLELGGRVVIPRGQPVSKCWSGQ